MPDDVVLHFGRDEYARRLTLTRRAMEARGIETLVVSDPSNMAWLTAYDGWSFYVHQAVIITHDDDPVWWGRMQDTNGAKRTVYMDVDHIVGYPEHYVQSTEIHPMQHLATVIADRGLAARTVGVELDNYYYSAAAHAALTESLGAGAVDATGLVNRQRAVKSAAELEYMRIAGRITAHMHTRAADIIRPGLRKNDLVAEISQAGLEGVDGYGGDYPAIVPIVPSGADASAPHLTWDDRPIEHGVGTCFELSGCYRRYHAPFSRTIFLGTPPPRMTEAAKAVDAALDAAFDAARPGNRGCDVATALYGVLSKAGIERDGRCGYPIGLSYPPDWGERTISFRREDENVLEAGMTFHFMPGLWMDTWGLEITECAVITEHGAERLADHPRDLVIIP